MYTVTDLIHIKALIRPMSPFLITTNALNYLCEYQVLFSLNPDKEITEKQNKQWALSKVLSEITHSVHCGHRSKPVEMTELDFKLVHEVIACGRIISQKVYNIITNCNVNYWIFWNDSHIFVRHQHNEKDPIEAQASTERRGTGWGSG